MNLTNLEKLKTKEYREQIVGNHQLFLQFMKENNIDSCYDFQTNDCNGGCQGASDCIIAKWYRDEISEPSEMDIRRDKYNTWINSMIFDEAVKGIDFSDMKAEVLGSIRRI